LIEPPRFEWHAPKAAANRAKHKVTFEEATTVFGDPLGRIVDDPRHSQEEERFVLLANPPSAACSWYCSPSVAR